MAKAGSEDGFELFGHSIIVNPQGEITAQATSWDDELITADCDLDMCTLGRATVFAFDKHRRPEAYGRITGQVGAVDPPVWSKDLIRGGARLNKARTTSIMENTPLPVSLPVRWQPDRTRKPPPWPVPTLGIAVGRGFRSRCPACGKTHMFKGICASLRYARIATRRSAWRGRTMRRRISLIVRRPYRGPVDADPGAARRPPRWVQTAMFLPVTLALALGLLRPIKGGTVGLMLRLGLLKTAGDE